MPRKFSITDKRKWLEKYEAGAPEASIAKESGCDLRTIKKGIEDASRERDARIAKVEVMKVALSKHQESLSSRLKEILSSLTMPPRDWAVLSWHGSRDSILREDNHEAEYSVHDEAGDHVKGRDACVDIVGNMLRQHLRNDKLWKILDRREKAYASHRLARIALQRKMASLLEQATGYRLEEGSGISPPYICSYTAGDLFYRKALSQVFGEYQNDDWQDEIIIDRDGGYIQYRNLILAHVPGAESECRENLLKAFQRIELLPEVTRVASTWEELEESTLKARHTIEEIQLLGYLPGVCKVCRRLGL